MVYECPSSSVPSRIWSVIGLFWHCYQRTPGLAGWELRRTHLPRSGGVEEQDHWTMWAFRVLDAEFYQIAQDTKKAEPVLTSHVETKKQFGIK